MIGRLVQYEEVRRRGQGSRERDSAALAPRQDSNLFEYIVSAKEECPQQGAELGLTARGGLGAKGIERSLFAVKRLGLMLCEKRYLDIVSLLTLAFEGLGAEEHAGQRRLAGSVLSDQSNFVPPFNQDRAGFAEDLQAACLGLIGLGKLTDLEYSPARPWWLRKSK